MRRTNSPRQINRKPEHGGAPGRAAHSSPHDMASPEAAAGTLDVIERGLQGLAGEGVQVNMDPGSRAQSILSLQQMLGNQRVQRRLVQRDGPDGGTGSTTTADASAPTLPEDLRTFRAGGPYPAAAEGQTVTPSTGMGGFNARYDANTMVLTITLNIGMSFHDGMTISGNRVTATQSSMNPSAVQINRALSRLRGQARQDALDRVRTEWQWTGASDPRITSWMAAYRANVTGAWSSAGTGIVFQGSRTGWDSQLARVNVVVNTQDVTATAPGSPIPAGPRPVHCWADIYKTPDEDVFGAEVGPGSASSGTDQTLALGSGQVVAQSHLLTQSVFFENNSSTLTARARDRLRKWIISFQATPGTPGNSIAITGRANTKGDDTEEGRVRNEELAQRRADAVDVFLRTTAVEGSLLRNAETRITAVTGVGATGAGEGAEWRRADIVVGTGQGQNIAAHEFGHMLGLDDEYASTPQRDAAGNPIHDANGDEITRGLISGTGGEVGSTTAHDTLATQMGLGGSVHENNDNIMSLGSTIRPQHYATFMQALHTVSGITDWRVRP